MQRFLISVSALAILALGAGTAQAQSAGAAGSGASVGSTSSGIYGKLNAGFSWGQGRVSESWLVGGGFGYRFDPNFRADVTVDYRPDYNQTTNFNFGAGANTGLHNWTTMLSGYYDFAGASMGPLVPFVGGGVGLARNSFNGTTTTAGGFKNQFAWQLTGGASYSLSQMTALEVSYRYLDAGQTGFGSRLRASEVVTGLRVAF